jgi:hypothetical protein
MTILEWVGIITAGLAIIGGVAGVIRYVAKNALREELEEIKHELKPNSGSSIKDQITRLEKKQLEIQAKQKDDDERFESRLDKLESKIDKVFEIIIDKLT